MKRLIRWLVAGIFLAFLAAAVGADGSEFTVRAVEASNGEMYLVDENGKPLYVFVPYGYEPITLKEEWSEEARSAFAIWEPLTVSSPNALNIEASLAAGHIFEVVTFERGAEVVHQVVWGGSATRDDSRDEPLDQAFWPLYTFRADGPLTDYSMHRGDKSPGYVENLWELARGEPQSAPAPGDPRRLVVNPVGPGGGVGDSLDGGP